MVAEPAISLDYLFFNVTVKPFDNLGVRQALSWAIDRAKIVKLLSGTGQPLNQIYPAGLPGHVDGAAGDFYGYDPAKAKQLLAAGRLSQRLHDDPLLAQRRRRGPRSCSRSSTTSPRSASRPASSCSTGRRTGR